MILCFGLLLERWNLITVGHSARNCFVHPQSLLADFTTVDVRWSVKYAGLLNGLGRIEPQLFSGLIDFLRWASPCVYLYASFVNYSCDFRCSVAHFFLRIQLTITPALSIAYQNCQSLDARRFIKKSTQSEFGLTTQRRHEQRVTVTLSNTALRHGRSMTWRLFSRLLCIKCLFSF